MLSLEAFADWAEKQPAEKEYDYWDHENCACGQYAKSLGICSRTNSLLVGFWDDAQFLASFDDRTFGSLATRLRKASAP